MTMKTTFFFDFTIADMFGLEAIKDTYKRAFGEWKNDYIYVTELTMVMNWKIFEHYEKNDEYAELYNTLFEKTYNYCVKNLKGEELRYFFETTD